MRRARIWRTRIGLVISRILSSSWRASSRTQLIVSTAPCRPTASRSCPTLCRASEWASSSTSTSTRMCPPKCSTPWCRSSMRNCHAPKTFTGYVTISGRRTRGTSRRCRRTHLLYVQLHHQSWFGDFRSLSNRPWMEKKVNYLRVQMCESRAAKMGQILWEN